MVRRTVALIASAIVVVACALFPSRVIAEGQIEIRHAGGRPLGFPTDIGIDRRGVLFVLDGLSRSILLFSPKGDFLRELPGRGIFIDPSAIATTPEGTLLVADGNGARVVEVDLSGKVRKEYSAGKGARLTGVALFGDTVFVVDNRNDKVVTFRRSGAKGETWGKRGDLPGDFDTPYRIAVDGAGRVFVSDVLNARVQWFTPFGKHLGTLKKFGAGTGKMLRPGDVDIDPRGRIWVTDGYTGMVQAFDEQGKKVGEAGDGGKGYVFGSPSAVAVSTDGLWVADQKNGRIHFFRAKR